MENTNATWRSQDRDLEPVERCVPGIVIADGGLGSQTESAGLRGSTFLYGEVVPEAPTLPFGRWKDPS